MTPSKTALCDAVLRKIFLGAAKRPPYMFLRPYLFRALRVRYLKA